MNHKNKKETQPGWMVRTGRRVRKKTCGQHTHSTKRNPSRIDTKLILDTAKKPSVPREYRMKEKKNNANSRPVDDIVLQLLPAD